MKDWLHSSYLDPEKCLNFDLILENIKIFGLRDAFVGSNNDSLGDDGSPVILNE